VQCSCNLEESDHHSHSNSEVFKIGNITNKWTVREDDLLLLLCKEKNKSWKEISEAIGNKTQYQCLGRYKKLYKTEKNAKWKRSEDLKIVELIELHGKNWNLIANELIMRTPDEVRDRFEKKLDPTIKRARFSKEEDATIIRLHYEYGNNWTEISKHLEDRCQSMIKNRFYILKSNQRKEIHANIFSNENNFQNNEIKLSASEASSNYSSSKSNSHNRRISRVSPIACVPSYEVDMNAENDHNSYNNPEYVNLIDNNFDQTNLNELSRPRKCSDTQIFDIEKNNNFTESYNNIFKEYPGDNTESYDNRELYNMFFLDSHQQKIINNTHNNKNNIINSNDLAFGKTKETEATTNNLQNSYNSYLDLNNPSDRLIFEKFNSIKKSFISINEIKNEFIINNNEVLSNILFY